MALIHAMSGRCSLCDKRFYAPYGYDQISNVAGSGEPRGVAFEDGRISKDSLGRPCANCLKMLWDWGGPIWADKPGWWDRPWEEHGGGLSHSPEDEAILLPVPTNQERNEP
jgi:hypothetical protein